MIASAKSSEADNLHALAPPSDWVQRWSHLVKPGGVVLDVACGQGRHAHWFHTLNCKLVVVDRSTEAIEILARHPNQYEAVVADIENGPWPFPGRQFDAVVVTNYLWRPLMPTLLSSLAPSGVLRVVAFEEGFVTGADGQSPRFIQRIVAAREVCEVGESRGEINEPDMSAPKILKPNRYRLI